MGQSGAVSSQSGQDGTEVDHELKIPSICARLAQVRFALLVAFRASRFVRGVPFGSLPLSHSDTAETGAHMVQITQALPGSFLRSGTSLRQRWMSRERLTQQKG
eukprot:9077575-Karenia_brevis.AAC.1